MATRKKAPARKKATKKKAAPRRRRVETRVLEGDVVVAEYRVDVGELARNVSPAQKQVCVDALAAGLPKTQAAQAAGFHRRTLLRLTTPGEELYDEEFHRACIEATEEALDGLEREAIRRGKEGVRKPLVYQGQVIGEVREYSDRLLMMVMSAKSPAYRQAVYGGRGSPDDGQDGGDGGGVVILPEEVADSGEWGSAFKRYLEHKPEHGGQTDGSGNGQRTDAGGGEKPVRSRAGGNGARPRRGKNGSGGG